MQYVHFGRLRVPRYAATQFEAAEHYLCRDSRERSILRRVEHARDGRHYTLRIDSHNDDSFDPSTDTVDWDPRSALRTTRCGHQSPALGLGHELDHAAESRLRYDRNVARIVPRYDNAEERRVIRGSEAHAARTLHESQRYDHGGRCYRVPGPTAMIA